MPIVLALLFVAGAAGLVVYFRSRTAEANIPPESNGIMTPTKIVGTLLSDEENRIIFRVAEETGIDARFLAAIRKAEMGGPGNEFGVLSDPSVNTYDKEVHTAANSILNSLGRFNGEYGYVPVVNGRYTDDFIAYFGARWAPIGASNDPRNLNSNWVRNATTWYGRIEYA